MNQKGFTNIVLISVIVILMGVAIYFVLVKQPNPIIQLPFGTSTLSKIEYEDLSKFDSEKSLDCISTFDTSDREKEFVVNTDAGYQELLKYESSFSRCANFTLPPIDFSQKTLLGKYTSGGGCSIDFAKKVYRDDQNRKIVYIIDIIEQGFCEKLEFSNNWILIPKVSPNYIVEFQVK